jgi:hypothetical protein
LTRPSRRQAALHRPRLRGRVRARGQDRRNRGKEGIAIVYLAGPKFEILSSNKLADDCSPYCLSTVAVSDGQLFVRTASFLWAIGDRRAK